MTSVGLVQISWELRWSDTSGDQGSTSLSLFPYSIGLLRSYAQSQLGERLSLRWLEPVFRRESVADAVDKLESADVIGFSVYVWNAELSLAIAAEVKRRRPETLIIFGGPHVPDASEVYLRARPFVDVACHGEGEMTFAALLERAANTPNATEHREVFSDVAGVSYLDADDRYVANPRRARIEHLDCVPSPYLSGAFDDLIERYPEQRWVATWETNRGCPFSCTFCDWGSATASRVHTFDLERLTAEIDWFAAHEVGYLFCCDANFGLLPRDVEIAKLLVASRKRTGYPFSVSVQNAKNATERTYEIQSLLASEMHTTGVTLALQSTSPDTLVAIRRQNIRSSSYEELQRRYIRDGIYTYTDLIIGLPGDTYASFVDSIATVVASGQHDHIQFHNCSVLPNAEMGDPAYKERFGLVTTPQPIRASLSPSGEPPEIEELLDTVVATKTMPEADWIRAKTFAWMTDFAYFDRVLQIPLAVALDRTGVSFRVLIEELCSADSARFPTLSYVRDTFEQQARSIQLGGIEYLVGPTPQELLWPADLYVIGQLARMDAIDALYAEARAVLLSLLGEPGTYRVDVDGARRLVDSRLVAQGVALNRALLCLPNQFRDIEIRLEHDLYSYWGDIRRGSPGVELPVPATYRVRRSERSWPGFDEWERFLAASHGFDKRRYLYGLDARVLASAS